MLQSATCHECSLRECVTPGGGAAGMPPPLRRDASAALRTHHEAPCWKCTSNMHLTCSALSMHGLPPALELPFLLAAAGDGLRLWSEHEADLWDACSSGSLRIRAQLQAHVRMSS